MRKRIEYRTWQDYTPFEKRELLNHWWYYYGHLEFTFAEWLVFDRLARLEPNTMWIVAIQSYVNGLTSGELIEVMRNGKLNAYLSTACITYEQMTDEEKEEFHHRGYELLAQMTSTYNEKFIAPDHTNAPESPSKTLEMHPQ